MTTGTELVYGRNIKEVMHVFLDQMFQIGLPRFILFVCVYVYDSDSNMLYLVSNWQIGYTF